MCERVRWGGRSFQKAKADLSSIKVCFVWTRHSKEKMQSLILLPANTSKVKNTTNNEREREQGKREGGGDKTINRIII